MPKQGKKDRAKGGKKARAEEAALAGDGGVEGAATVSTPVADDASGKRKGKGKGARKAKADKSAKACLLYTSDAADE